jgi:YD repeat-containing protein
MVTSSTDPLGNLTTYEYDAQGNLTAITDPEQNVQAPAERLKTRITCNAYGQVLTVTDPLDHTTTFTYDADARLCTITQAPLNPVGIDDDAADRRTLLTHPNGVSTEYQYDAASRLVVLIYRNTLGPFGGLRIRMMPQATGSASGEASPGRSYPTRSARVPTMRATANSRSGPMPSPTTTTETA